MHEPANVNCPVAADTRWLCGGQLHLLCSFAEVRGLHSVRTTELRRKLFLGEPGWRKPGPNDVQILHESLSTLGERALLRAGAHELNMDADSLATPIRFRAANPCFTMLYVDLNQVGPEMTIQTFLQHAKEEENAQKENEVVSPPGAARR